MSNQINPMTFGQTYELTLTGSSGECAVQIKKSGYNSPSIDTLVVNEILISGSMIEPTPVPKPTATPKPTSTPKPKKSGTVKYNEVFPIETSCGG